MKVSKSALKQIVKECLVEILCEGLAQGEDSSLSESVTHRLSQVSSPRKATKKPRQKRASDHIRFNKAVNNSTKMLTDDPVMASIFADTAKTTLQEQLRNGDSAARPAPGPAGPSFSSQQSIGDPTSIFGSESADKWASLAFSSPKNKR